MRLVSKVGGVKTKTMSMFSSRSGRAPLSPDLPPLAKTRICSQPAIFNAVNSVGQGTNSYVCDPSGGAPGSLGVFQWSTRFSGFQQYRVTNTEWILRALRTNIGTVTSSQCAGVAVAWIDDDPQAGVPSQAAALASNVRALINLNGEGHHMVTYTSNEAQDLNLTDISLSPAHVVGNGVINAGQHCLQVYTDNGFYGLDSGLPGTGSTPLIWIQAIYDVEFYGIGGV
jgi:hypothetical protein